MFQNRRRDMYIERTKATCPATVFFFPRRAGQVISNMLFIFLLFLLISYIRPHTMISYIVSVHFVFSYLDLCIINCGSNAFVRYKCQKYSYNEQEANRNVGITHGCNHICYATADNNRCNNRYLYGLFGKPNPH